MNELFRAEVTIPGRLRRAEFDRKTVNQAIAREAREVRKVARRLIARRAISSAGQFPGRDTGALWRSVKVTTNRQYLFAIIRPVKTPEMGSFHPYMLLRGTKRRLQKLAPGEGRGVSNRRRRGDRVAALAERAASGDYIINPRANYMEEAMNRRRTAAREALYAAMERALVVR